MSKLTSVLKELLVALLNPIYRLIRAESIPDSYDIVLTVHRTPGWIYRKLGWKQTIQKYIGWSTVWYSLPHMRRCDTPREETLSNLYKWAKYYKEIDS